MRKAVTMGLFHMLGARMRDGHGRIQGACEATRRGGICTDAGHEINHIGDAVDECRESTVINAWAISWPAVGADGDSECRLGGNFDANGIGRLVLKGADTSPRLRELRPCRPIMGIH